MLSIPSKVVSVSAMQEHRKHTEVFCEYWDKQFRSHRYDVGKVPGNSQKMGMFSSFPTALLLHHNSHVKRKSKDENGNPNPSEVLLKE